MSSMSDGAQPAHRRGWGGKVGRRERTSNVIKAIRAANGGWVTVRYLMAVIGTDDQKTLNNMINYARSYGMVGESELIVNKQDVNGSMYRIAPAP
jgi:hypothetical protein